MTAGLADQRDRPATSKINSMAITRADALFIAAALAETGGGYLVWRWLREGAPVIADVLGAIIMVAYAIIPALQKGDDFGRIYAAHGRVLVASLLRGWGIDGKRPDGMTGPAPR